MPDRSVLAEDEKARRRAQAVLVHRITTRIAANLDLDSILADLVDRSMEVFGADRALVSIRTPGGYEAVVSRGLSTEWIEATRRLPELSLWTQVLRHRRPLVATHYATDPRGADLQPFIAAEGFDTVALAPLVASDEVLGFLALYHDATRPYDEDDLEALLSVAEHAAIAIQHARAFTQQERWTAQLASIHDLGSRLSALSTVPQIAMATVSELHTIIDYDSVRVYRVDGGSVVPVAWRGEHTVYGEETFDQLAVRVGDGITGWVAQHGISQYLPHASRASSRGHHPGYRGGDRGVPLGGAHGPGCGGHRRDRPVQAGAGPVRQRRAPAA